MMSRKKLRSLQSQLLKQSPISQKQLFPQLLPYKTNSVSKLLKKLSL